MGDTTQLAKPPTIEFDGVLKMQDQEPVSCAVQIWFAEKAYGPMAIKVVSPAIENELAQPTEIQSVEGLYCSAGCVVRLEGVWVRQWTSFSEPARQQLQHSVELASVRRLVVSSLGRRNAADSRSRSRLVIKLSESRYLSPTCRPRPADTGLLKFEQRHHVIATHPALGSVRFQRHFRFSPAGGTDLLVSSELVAVLRRPLKEGNVVDARGSARAFEDFCLLASVAARTRIAVRGWKIDEPGAFEESFVNPLESTESPKPADLQDVLVFRELAGSFLSHAAQKWQSCTPAEQHKLRNACYALAPQIPQNIETSFLGMFAALEGLVSIFLRRGGGGLVCGKTSTWALLRRQLSQAIDSVSVEDEGFDPSAMKRNLSALKRAPLRESTERVLKSIGAWSDQLWPLFDSSTAALSSIRNVLAHGEPLEPQKMGALVVARTHLRLHLERTLCCTLQWSLDETSVSNAVMLGDDRGLAAEIAAARAVILGEDPGSEGLRVLPIEIP